MNAKRDENRVPALLGHSDTTSKATALPIIADSSGNINAGLHYLSDQYGFLGEFTPAKDMKVAQPFRMIGTNFGTSTDSNFWTTTTSGAGSASSVSNSVATMSSGTANSGYGQIQTVRLARYNCASPLQWHGVIRVTATAVALNTRRWGAFTTTTVTTPSNGTYFEFSPTGVLSVNAVSGGSVTSISSGSFNGAVSSYTLDTNRHYYEIIYCSLGAWFFIDSVLIHTMSQTTTPLAQTLIVPITITSINSSSGVTSGTVECWGTSVVKLGGNETMPTSKFVSGVTTLVNLKTGAGELHSINLSGVSNNSVVSLFDSTATLTSTLWSSGSMGAQTAPFNIDLHGLPYYTGLSLSITVANSNATVIYE